MILKEIRTYIEQNYEKMLRLLRALSRIPAPPHHEHVGSHRYQVEVKTEGGHSFRMFGKPNAIAVLSEIVGRIYEIEVPKIGDSRTSYNVGMIEGGTSVNTIAQNEKMLCEYRSDSVECLKIMQDRFADIFAAAASEGVKIDVERIGDRPCASDVDEEKEAALIAVCRGIIEDVIQEQVICKYGDSGTSGAGVDAWY